MPNTRTLLLVLGLGTALLAGCATNDRYGYSGPRPDGKFDDAHNRPTQQKVWGTSDEAITHNVRAALQGNAAINRGAMIQVQVKDGKVLLTGSAPSDEDRIRAVRTAERVHGVREVRAMINTN